MTSKEAKLMLYEHLLIDRHRAAVLSESQAFWNCDILGVTSTGYTSEFEIKVSKSDLQSESRAIRAALEKGAVNPFAVGKFAATKWFKHSAYLGTDKTMGKVRDMPNEFSFFVPKELIEVARKAVVGTPYGVYSKFPYSQSWASNDDVFQWVVAPKKLHRNKLDEKMMIKVMRKSSLEVYFMRKKLWNPTPKPLEKEQV